MKTALRKPLLILLGLSLPILGSADQAKKEAADQAEANAEYVGRAGLSVLYVPEDSAKDFVQPEIAAPVERTKDTVPLHNPKDKRSEIVPSRGLASQGAEVDIVEENEALASDELAEGEDYEPPFTLNTKFSRDLGVEGPAELLETGESMELVHKEIIDSALMIAGRKVPLFMEDIAERALEGNRITIVLWALILIGCAFVLKLFFSLQTAQPRRTREVAIVIPFRERNIENFQPLQEEVEEKTIWQDRQARVSMEEVSEVAEKGLTSSIQLTDPNWQKNTQITENTQITGAIASWTPRKERKLSPKKFYLRQEKKTKKWYMVQADINGKIGRTIGEIAAGTVVDGKTLGRHFAAKFYKLNAQGHWYPTSDKPQLVLAVNNNLSRPKRWL